MINADNGPENNTGRTQWIKRLAEFSGEHQITVKLAKLAKASRTSPTFASQVVNRWFCGINHA